ncbi:CheB methylesterase domain-containing protein [Fuscovulum blasticum]|uniref:CheB methylesterase domain-containing protein n=1 Tax=Fuscovulum blasticum TaxID=1075 RepID=UPI000D3E89C6|nr:CheB methylesterase domain-containing protein [Fuscovulum blasticum]AWD20868.1 hypothetical protein B6K69_03630 [Fuscovulum blasticum]
MRRVLIVTPQGAAAARLAQDAAARPGLHLLGTAADLSAAYVLAERDPPDVVLVARDLARSPEFGGLVSLFAILGIGWIEIPTAPPPDEAALSDLWRRVQVAAAPPPPHRPGLPGQGARFHADRLIVIGASTGGIEALLTILGAFPADCPPTAIVQHTGAAFSDSLIRLFARCSAARVVPAQTGVLLAPGTVVVGAGCAGHLRLAPGDPPRAELVAGAAISGHLPSVDALFDSAARFGPRVAAALLTGMGRDGARGLLALRQAGAHTIAQDAATSVVWGMPRVAVEAGAAAQVLPLRKIGAELLAHCRDRRREGAGR